MFKTPLEYFVTGFTQKSISKHPICLTDLDSDYILEKIKRQEKIEVERTISGNIDEEYYWCKH